MNRKLFRIFLLLDLVIFLYLIVIYIIPNIPEHQNRIDLVADVAKFANPLIGTAK
ncbi:26534_t:CDS:1, partial [Dentiscutata erythropus]